MRRHVIRFTHRATHLLQIVVNNVSEDDELFDIIRFLKAGHQDKAQAYFKANSLVIFSQEIYLEGIFC